jgi:hypothetical protein
MRWLLDKAFGGVVGFVVSTIIGAAFIMLGIVPRQALAELFLPPPTWVTNGWTRLAIVLLGVCIIVVAAIWKIFSERRLAAATARQEFQKLIADARLFVVQSTANDGVNTDFYKALQQSVIYLQLRPYLSEKFRRSCGGRVAVVPADGSNIPGLASMFLDEIDRLERERGLSF